MKRINSWREWLKSLIHATISGGAAAISTSAVAPETFNFGAGLNKLLFVIGFSAVISMSKFLAVNPFPERSELDEQILNADDKLIDILKELKKKEGKEA